MRCGGLPTGSPPPAFSEAGGLPVDKPSAQECANDGAGADLDRCAPMGSEKDPELLS